MEAQKAHRFKEMVQSLLSVPVLCDADCTVVFKRQCTSNQRQQNNNRRTKRYGNEPVVNAARD